MFPTGKHKTYFCSLIQTAKSVWGREIEGQFEIREVNDPQMGKCVEIELKPQGELRLEDVEYLTLQLKTPVSTTAQNAGVWIKGNGSWGAVDITGKGLSWMDNGDLAVRWTGDATTNFDGWNCIRYPSGKNTGKPASISGLRLTFPRQTLVGPELTPVPLQKIRIKSIVLF